MPKQQQSEKLEQPPLVPVVSLRTTGLDSLVGYQVRKIELRAMQAFANIFARENIAWGQYSAFVTIQMNEGSNQKALAKALDIDQSTLIPTLDHLERCGWIKRTRDPRDRRSVLLSATPAGSAKLRRLKVLIQKHDETILSGLSKKERDMLLDLLRKMAASDMGA